jgi:Sec-independent protein translocase protein TatA
VSFLGIGAPELLLILLLIVMILGPERAKEAGTTAGRFIKRMTSSEFWRELVQAAHFMQQLPQNLVRMAELEDIATRLNQDMASMQRDLKTVSQPLENITASRVLKEPLQAIQSADQELRRAVSGSLASAQPAPVPVAESGPSVEPLPVAEPIEPTEPLISSPPGPSVQPAPSSPEVDLDIPEQDPMERDLARFAAEWPALVRRLDEIERRQAQLAEQMKELQAAGVGLPEPSREDKHL